jgi:hypothetical protein
MVVLGIHQETERNCCVLNRPVNGVDEHEFAKPAPLEMLVDGQSPNANRRQGRVTRQWLRLLGRQIDEGHARCRQCVVGRYLAGGVVDDHKAVRDPAADVLSHLRSDIAVESVVAMKRDAVVPTAELLAAYSAMPYGR